MIMSSFHRAGLVWILATFTAGLAAAQSTSRVSVNSAGAQADAGSGWQWRGSALSADGRYVAFTSYATSLVPGSTNYWPDAFLRDRQSGTTTQLSVATGGLPGNAGVSLEGLSISSDGRYVAFASSATNLDPADTNAKYDVFVRDCLNGTTVRVSVDAAGGQANDGSFQPYLSADGRFVAFQSYATNLVAGDLNAVADIFVKDLQSGAIVRVNVDSAGTEALPGLATDTYPGSYTPVLSADGRFVAFASSAPNLVAGDTNGMQDIFVEDRDTDANGIFDEPGAIATTRVSVEPVTGVEADNVSRFPSLTGDGRFVSFHSSATNLVAGDTNGFYDAFLLDRQAALLTRISVDALGVQGNGDSDFVQLSLDGRYATYQSAASNLVPNDTNFARDIFLYDLARAQTSRVSVGYAVANASGASNYPTLSADGQRVAFASTATNLVTNDTNLMLDVFVRDLGQPGVAFCFGDGSSVACPCANSGLAGRGCDNSEATGGARLESSGAPMLGWDTLVFSCSGERSAAPTIVFQGDAASAALPFGDGLRCAGGSLKRLYVKIASGGTITAPEAGDASISARSAAQGDTLAEGMTRYYQTYYRDPLATFCPAPAGDLWNASSALSVTWLP